MAKKEVLNYKKITLQDMVDYIENNAPQDKAWFKSVAFDVRPAKTKVFQYNPDGTPLMKVNKDGKAYHVSKMVAVEGGQTKAVFNLLQAKNEFCKRYMPEIIPVAKPKAPKAGDVLKDW